jgi:RecB family exonuclease
MRIKILYEGHYRTLEEDFLELTERILSEGKQLTVVSAGTGQLDRLRKLLLDTSGAGIIGGIEFLPGIRHLAQKISSIPAPLETVSHSDRTLFALHAMEGLKKGESLFDLRENTETAHSMGSFFEDLFEHGITPELYEITSLSLSGGQTATEKTIGRILGRYGEERNKGYFSCGDMILKREIPDGIRETYIFYGFYDLNPSQRRFLKRFMSSSGETYWFSPVSENSQWSSVYLRTRRLLQDIGIGSLVRSGNRKQMNSFAGFFEALPTQSRPSVPTDGFRITAVSGEIGSCRAVLKRISELREKENIELGHMAVVRRKQEGESLVRLAHHEGIPVNVPLKAKLSEIPEGEFILNLLNAVNMDFYYVYLESLLASGILKDDCAADPYEIAEVVENSGIRMGLDRWRDWYSSLEAESRLGSFLRKLDTFFSGLPRKAHPGEYIRLIRTFFEETALESVRLSIMDSLFDPGAFRFAGEVSIAQFADALKLYYKAKDVVLRKPDRDGFQFLTIEKVRGSLFDSVLLMDMEEGIYPGSPNEDPRLSDELRERLQMTLKTEREIEDGFLLRQAGEAAVETLDIIYREQDSAGSELSPSPFIAAIVLSQDDYSPDPLWFRRISSSPVEQILKGSHPGQSRARAAFEGDYPGESVFASALKAENSRMNYKGFDEYDGILSLSPVRRDIFSPTFFERYVRCPFAFLMEKGWKIGRTEISDISSSPDPMIKGSMVHEAVEEIIEKHGLNPSKEEVESIIRRTAASYKIACRLGAEYLKEIFIEKQTEVIAASLYNLSVTGWKYLDKEKYLEGHLGELRINGRIDLIMEDSDSNLVLLDLKTGIPPALKGIEYGKLYQLPFYYKLAGENYPDRSIAVIAYASISDSTPGKLSSLTGHEMEERMGAVQKNAERIVSMIRDGLFPPIPTSSCDYCVYKGLCRRTPFDRVKGKAQSDSRMEMFREIMLKQ